MEVRSQLGFGHSGEPVDARVRPRLQIEVAIRIYPRDCPVVRGQTVDISESGISAMLRTEIPVGEVVRLDSRYLWETSKSWRWCGKEARSVTDSNL